MQPHHNHGRVAGPPTLRARARQRGGPGYGRERHCAGREPERRLRVGHQRQRRQPGRAAELLGGAEQPRREAGVLARERLLALMADEIVAEVLAPAAENEAAGGWRERLRAIALRSHAAFVAHPWVLEISGRRPHLGHNAVAHAEQLLAAVEPLGLDDAGAWSVLYVVNDYTLGHALRVAHGAREPAQSYPEFDPEAHPRLAAALARGRTAGSARDDISFEAGLDTVLDGIERRYRAGELSPRGRAARRRA
jgi:hypothetical protein